MGSKKSAIVSFLMLAFSHVPAFGKTEVTFARLDWPPFDIPAGQFQEKNGVGNYMRETLMKDATDFNYKTVDTNYKRLLAEIKDGNVTCGCLIIKSPEREQMMHFSIPATVAPSQSVIFKKSRSSEFPESVPLEEFLKNKALKMGVPPGRQYGPAIDGLIEKYATKIVKTTGQNPLEQLVQMLEHGRIDYFIEYDAVVKYYFDSKSKPIEFASSGIQGMPSFIPAYVGCSKNAAGAEVIKKFNEILRRERGKDAYKKNPVNWLSEKLGMEYAKFYDTTFMNIPE